MNRITAGQAKDISDNAERKPEPLVPTSEVDKIILDAAERGRGRTTIYLFYDSEWDRTQASEMIKSLRQRGFAYRMNGPLHFDFDAIAYCRIDIEWSEDDFKIFPELT